MELKEMVEQLRTAGYLVKDPIDRANCKHPNVRALGWVISDGSSHIDNWCPDCMKNWSYDTAPSKDIRTGLGINPWPGTQLKVTNYGASSNG